MGSNQIINMVKLIIKHIQTQINKQKVSLLQDQNASNTITYRILSELENLVWALQNIFVIMQQFQKNFKILLIRF